MRQTKLEEAHFFMTKLAPFQHLQHITFSTMSLVYVGGLPQTYSFENRNALEAMKNDYSRHNECYN